MGYDVCKRLKWSHPAFSKRKPSSLPNSPSLFFLYQVFAVYWIFIATVGGQIPAFVNCEEEEEEEEDDDDLSNLL